MSRLKTDYEVATVLESEMTVDAADPMRRIFNEALLDHIIKFASEDAGDLRANGREPRRIRYRVCIEVADVEMAPGAGGEA